MTKALQGAVASFFILGLSACSAPGFGVPWGSSAPASQTKAASCALPLQEENSSVSSPSPSLPQMQGETIQGKTTSEKAYSIGRMVTQQHKQLLLVINGRLVQNDAICLSPDEKGRSQFNPLWMVLGEENPQDRGRVYGLAYTVAVLKRGEDISYDDEIELVEAMGELISLTAHYLVPDKAKAGPREFYFVDMFIFKDSTFAQGNAVAVRAFDMPAVHASVEDVIKEKAKGDGANWDAFVRSHNIALFPYALPSD